MQFVCAGRCTPGSLTLASCSTLLSSLCLCFSSRSTSLTLMMRITSLIRMSFCTKLGRYGTLAPVLQIRPCLPPAITKVSPTVSFCFWLHLLHLYSSCLSLFLPLSFSFLQLLSFFAFISSFPLNVFHEMHFN